MISTHTLTWSVTEDMTENAELTAISTHTLTWSVTFTNGGIKKWDLFQLTRSRGA